MENSGRQSEIRKKLFQNSALLGMSRILLSVISLVCVPFVVKSLGWEGYGVWETILALTGLMTFIFGPLSSTLLWRIANTADSRGFPYTFRLLQIGVFISLLAFVLLVPLAWIFRGEIVERLNMPAQYLTIAVWLTPAVIAISLLGGINESMMAFLCGYQKAGIMSMIQMLGTLLQYGVIILGLCLGFGFLSLLAGLLGGTLFQGIGYYWQVFRLIITFSYPRKCLC